jgi:hypothetical protein
VEVVDKQERKKIKKKVELKTWRPENMKQVEFHMGMVFVSVVEIGGAIQSTLCSREWVYTTRRMIFRG